MRADRIFAITLSNLITGTTPTRLFGHRLDRVLHQANVVLGLIRSPPLGSVIPNIIEVGAGTRREDVAAHVAAFSPRLLFWRLRSMKSSKSKGVEGPL